MSRGPALVAVIGPILVVAGALTWLSAWDPSWSAEVEQRTARRGAEEVARELGRAKPELVAVGNSVTKADLVPEVVARQLDLGERVAVATSPGSLAPTWYLILKNEVFGRGHRPARVVLANPLPNALEVRPASEIELDRMAEFMDGEEPELKRIMGADTGLSALSWSLRLRRARLRTTFLDAVRDLSVRSLLPLRSVQVETAFEHVFAAPADPRLVFRGVAVMPDRSPDPVAPEDSFLPAIAAMAAKHHAELVFVDTPRLDSSAFLDEAKRAAVLGWMADHGVRYIDLTAGFEAEDFLDAWHLDAGPAARLTRRLAVELGGADAGPSVAVRTGRSPDLTPAAWEPAGPCAWRGALPGLSWSQARSSSVVALRVTEDERALRASETPVSGGCAGAWWIDGGQLVVSPSGGDVADHRWAVRQADLSAPDVVPLGPDTQVLVAPGQTITWALPPGARWLAMQGRTLSEGSSARVSVTLHDQRESLAWTERKVAFRLIRERPEGAGKLVLTTEPGAPWLWVHRVDLTDTEPRR